MSSFYLKMLALVLMVIDHVAQFIPRLFNGNYIFRTISSGRYFVW